MPNKYYQSLLKLSISCLIVLTIGCTGEPQTTESVEDIQFNLEFDLIHEIEEFPHPNHLFYFPEITAVRSYGENDFLVTDNWLKQILHIDENGELVQKIGREGKGPGEFTNLWTVIPMLDGKIGVSNRGDARSIIFNSEGDLLAQHVTKPEDPYIRGKVYPAGDDSYFTANHRPRSENSDCIFVELDDELRPQEPCFGSYNELNESDIRFLRVSGISPFGDMHFLDEDRFMFVRGSYDGTHYIYHRREGDWEIERTVTGFTEIPASVSDVPDTPSNREKGNWVRVQYAGEPAMFVIRHNQSMGYQVYDNEHVLHFTSTQQEGERILGVELFTHEGDFLGYQSLAELQDQYGFNSYVFRLSAYNGGRLLVGTKFGLYIFDLTLTFSK